MVKKSILLVVCAVLTACDRFPGPTLRNEFPTEVKISVLYGDGTTYSDTWLSCQTVSIGAPEIGKFGLKEKDVSINAITVEVGNEIIHAFGEEDIKDLLERSREAGAYVVWVLDPSGVRFSTSHECRIAG